MRRTSAFSVRRTSTVLLILLSIVTITAAVSASNAYAPEEEVGVSEFITVYADDCATPKTVFEPGEIVCVQAGNFPVDPSSAFRYRRFSWVTPNRSIADQTNIKADPQFDRFAIPTSGSTGTWHVTTLNVDAARYANARFVVRKPFAITADLSIFKDGPEYIYAGQRAVYTLSIYNPGPDTAEGIEFVTEVPTGMTFVALKQESGPFFECKMPLRGETGRIYCSTKGMRLDESAKFYAYYDVSSYLRPGTICSSTTQVMSFAEELNKEDNVSLSEVKVVLENEPDPDGPPPEDN
ncbi:MAG TPA: hypothetical protein VGW12_19615 [Pyrinomonadaceae bacterium]|nr:hypothetical protein [Pyrinomonadaceae bacterium]